MDKCELEALLDDLESDRVERKASPSDSDKICQAVCAFANDLPDHGQPGVVFIGADDKGNPTRLEITDRLLQNLSAMRSDGNIVPFPSMDVQKRDLKGTNMAVVLVHPSNAPPVRYKGTIWIRVGPRRGIANQDDERRLDEKRRYRDIPADVRPIESAGIDELDELLFRRTYLPNAISREMLQQNQRNLEHQLLVTKFAHPGDPVHPTVLGLLVVGRDPLQWIPGAYVQFLRIDGNELGLGVKAEKKLAGPLPDLMKEIDDLLRLNIQSSVDIGAGLTETKSPDYPFRALQQIVRNAILHRSYDGTNAPTRVFWFDNRVEIHNPGGPFGQVTKENFGAPGVTDYRNPNIAAVMKELGYVQRFGMGIAIAREEMKKNGNPPPEFQVEDQYVAVIMRTLQ